MVSRNKLYGLVIFIVVLLVAIPYFIISSKKANDYITSIEFSGIVTKSINHIDGEKGMFFQLDSAWYHIIDIEVEEYIERGDSIHKEKGERCLTIIKEKKQKEICNIVFIQEVVNSGHLLKIKRELNKP